MMTGGLNKAGKPGGLNLNAFDEEDVDQSAAAEDEIRHAQQKQGVHESFLMATGSADHHVYIYDVGDAVARNWCVRHAALCGVMRCSTMPCHCVNLGARPACI
jgi:hypothetical protein